MLVSYKYRLYPSKAQKEEISKHFGCCRWIYNWALASKISHYQATGKSLHRYDLGKQFPVLKKSPETAWLSDVNSQSLQQELVYLEAAYARFFKENKGFPRFKSKHSDRKSFGCPQHVSINGSKIKLPKIGLVKASVSNKFSGIIKKVTVSLNPSGKYFASVLVDDGKDLPATGPYSEESTLGIDLGIKDFATLSTGEKIANPRHLKQNLARLKREQRRFSRKKKGSKNREKQRVKVALVHERVTNIRKDFLHKLSTRLVRENQALALETLNIDGMMKNHKLALHIADAGWGVFVGFCKYKSAWYGKTVLQIGRFEPSSRLCDCGWINRELTLRDRIWICPQCNSRHDRDIQAARNIKRMAIHPLVRRDAPEFKPVEIGVS